MSSCEDQGEPEDLLCKPFNSPLTVISSSKATEFVYLQGLHLTCWISSHCHGSTHTSLRSQGKALPANHFLSKRAWRNLTILTITKTSMYGGLNRDHLQEPTLIGTLQNSNSTHISWNLCWKSYAFFSLRKERSIPVWRACIFSLPIHSVYNWIANVNLKLIFNKSIKCKILWPISVLSFYWSDFYFINVPSVSEETSSFWVKFWLRL